MMMRLILFYSFLFLLSGCFLDQEGQDQSSVEIKMTENVVDGAAGGAILYLINKDLNIQRSFILTENSLNLPLRKGKWDFAIVAWIGDNSANPTLSGAIKCGLQKGVNLVSASESISLTFSDINCGDSFFSPPAHISNGSLKPLSIVNCLVVTNPVAGTYCDSSIGEAGSFKIKLYTKSTPTVKTALGFFGAVNAFLTSPSTSGVNVIESGCIGASGGNPPNSVTTTGRYFPFSSPDLFVPVSIEAYSDGTCSSGLKKYIFPTGLGATTGNANTLTNTVAKTISTPNSSDLYLAYQSLQITGDTNFGKVYFSNTGGVTNTFTITNNNPTSVTLGTPTITSSSNQMTLSVTSCTTSLAANSSCSFSVKFTPTVKNTSTGNLVVPVNGVNKTLSLTGFGVKDTFKTAPQGLTGFTTLPSNKINSVFIEPTSGTKYVATDGGLAIKSGTTWTTKTSADGLPSNIINTVFAYKPASQIHLYVGTPNGLSVSLDGGSTFSNLLPGEFINDVFAETVPSGSVTQTKIYVGTNNALKFSNNGGTNFTTQTISGGVFKVFVDSNGEIYVSNNSTLLDSYTVTVGPGGTIGLSATNYSFFYTSFLATPTTTATAKVSDILMDGSGDIYALVSDAASSAISGLYLLNPSNGLFEHKISLYSLAGATSVEYSEMAIDFSGNFLVAQKNGGGLNKVTPPTGAAGYTSSVVSLGSYSTSLNGVSLVSNISGHLVLVATSQQLLEASPSSGSIPTSLTWASSTSSGLVNNKVNTFGVSGTGTGTKIVVGSKEGSLLTSNNWSTKFSYSTNEITSILFTANDVFMGSKNANNSFLHQSSLGGLSSFTNLASSWTSPVTDLFATSSNIYAATDGSGIYYSTFSATWNLLSTSTVSGLLHDNFKNIYVDSSGNIYATYFPGTANQHKIVKITLGLTNSATHVGGFNTGVVINKFYVDPTGRVFVTTANGEIKRWASLSTLDSNTTPASISLGTFATAPVINDIFVKPSTGTNHIYVATNMGLFISLDDGLTWSQKTVAQGLPTNNIKKVFVDSNFDIYIATTGPDNQTTGGGFASTAY
jgi:hypothetical protein